MPQTIDALGRALLEADLPRQLRRVRRVLSGRSASDELRRVVAGKRVLITGASSGIGYELARQVIAAGADTIVVARRRVELEQLVKFAATQKGSATVLTCDLSDKEQVGRLVSKVLSEFGGVDILVNNAGRSIRRTMTATADRLHDYERIMRLNYFGAVWLTVPLVEQMRGTGGGHVINVSTMGTQFTGTPRFAGYVASKAALDQFAGSIAPEVYPDGVRFTTVHLPLVQTAMIEPAGHAWRGTPKLSLATGVSMVTDAIVRVPARVTSPMGNIVEVIDRIATRSMVAVKAREFTPSSGKSLPRVAIIGAGMSGLAMAKNLRAAGSDDFVIFEKSDTVGGTWRDNTYPGLTCDVPAHYYSYRDDLNPSWSRVFAPGAEIQRYFERVTDRRDLRRNIRFDTEIVEGMFRGGQWHLTAADGSTHSADVLVCATGVLHHPVTPTISGVEAFAGRAFHSAQWDHSADLEGKRVGIIGTGSTGVQITTALAATTAKVTLFQRTPQWVVAVPNPRIPAPITQAARLVPGVNRLLYSVFGGIFNGLADAPIRPGLDRTLFDIASHRSLATVRDPDLRAALTPDSEPMCKRLINSHGFYPAIQRPNVSLNCTGIDHIRAEGVVTSDGVLHELDILVFATGFDAHAYMRPMRLTGPSGITLADAWKDGPKAHNTTMVPGLPNMFTMMGPNSPIGNASLVPIAETQADYVLSWLKRMRERGIAQVEPTAAATDRFYAEVSAAMGPTVWVSGCDSWYLGPDGVPVLWPWPLNELRRRLSHPQWTDFVALTKAEVTLQERRELSGESVCHSPESGHP
jgi:cation diffusion facilitator CzcD-associated flavoprotein CzcO/NAD(P)-dependent dehydrogenase (short-subunit alcohol dehydrogenase family)